MNITAELKNIEKTRRILGDTNKYLTDGLKHSIYDIANQIVDEAKSNLQNNGNINTGTLLASIGILSEDDKSVVVGTDVFYAGYIEYGRGPVDPINAKFLHWIDKTTGKHVFARHVNATEPSPFMEPAVILKTKEFPEIVAEKQQEIIDTA